MFVNFSPADYNADETVTSLNFAARYYIRVRVRVREIVIHRDFFVAYD
jgi:hypothetical protein